MSKAKQEKKLYEGEKFEAFLNFLDSVRKGENAVFTDTDTGQRIFTQSAVNQQVLKALEEVKKKKQSVQFEFGSPKFYAAPLSAIEDKMKEYKDENTNR